MTSRADALAGLRYFSDIRAIAGEVGVQVPSDAAIWTRFAATDSIDLPALAEDAAMLGGVVATLTDAVDTARDAHIALPDAWRGRAADIAGAALAGHVRLSQDAVDQIRMVSRTAAAAVVALERVQEEKHRTLASLRTDHLAGHIISTMSADEVDALAEGVRSEVIAAIDLFTRTMDVVDATVGEILSALVASFAALPAPHEIAPPVRSAAPVHGSAPRRTPARTDIVVTPVATDGVSGRSDPEVVVAAISAGAAIAGAALTAASSVGMAVAGGLGSVVSHLIDAAAEGNGDGAVRDRHPESLGPSDRVVSVGHQEPGAGGVSADGSGSPRVATVPTPPEPPEIERPVAPRQHGTVAVEPRTPSVPADPGPEQPRREPDEHAPTSSRSQSPGAADDVAARGAPSVGQRSRSSEPPRGRPDPDDGGGLALAGDR